MRVKKAKELGLLNTDILSKCTELHLFNYGAIEGGNIKYYEDVQTYIKYVLETWDYTHEDTFDKKVREMCEIVVTYELDASKLH